MAVIIEIVKIQYFVDFFSKQINQTIFSFFNYYQLRMVFFSIIKKVEKIFNHRLMLLFNSHKKNYQKKNILTN